MTDNAQEAWHNIYMMLVLFPIVFITVMFAVISMISPDKDLKFYNFFFHFNPRRNLLAQMPLLFWLGIILFYFWSAGSVCWSNYAISWTAKGFDTFIEISKFPIALLSLTIPVGVFISRIHSTQQTAAQIDATDMKNRLDAFHAQRKGIVEYIASLGTIKLAHQVSLKMQVNQAFHSAVFCNSTHATGALEADVDVLRKVTYQVRLILNRLAQLMPDFGLLKGSEHYAPVQNPDGIYVDLISSLNDLCAKLSVSEYVITTGKERSVFRVRMPDGSEQRHERPVTNYYELIAVLNFCVTISYYAIVSENRSEEGSIFWEAEKLKEELNLLGYEVQDEVDVFQKLSSHLMFFPRPLVELIALDE